MGFSSTFKVELLDYYFTGEYSTWITNRLGTQIRFYTEGSLSGSYYYREEARYYYHYRFPYYDEIYREWYISNGTLYYREFTNHVKDYPSNGADERAISYDGTMSKPVWLIIPAHVNKHVWYKGRILFTVRGINTHCEEVADNRPPIEPRSSEQHNAHFDRYYLFTSTFRSFEVTPASFGGYQGSTTYVNGDTAKLTGIVSCNKSAGTITTSDGITYTVDGDSVREVPYGKPIRGMQNGTIQSGDLYKSSPPANAMIVKHDGLILHAKPGGGGKFWYSKNGAVYRIQ